MPLVCDTLVACETYRFVPHGVYATKSTLFNNFSILRFFFLNVTYNYLQRDNLYVITQNVDNKVNTEFFLNTIITYVIPRNTAETGCCRML